MTARLDVLNNGYVGDRVASTVVLVRDGDMTMVVDPGMVATRSAILDPLAALGVAPDEVTDVVFSHHHPDHTLNAALFRNARYHDHWATYVDDKWITRRFPDGVDTSDLSESVHLLLTPGHTEEDVSTVVRTAEGVVVCTHLWWTAAGPAEDPFAPDREILRASREKVLALSPMLIVPGHGAPFAPSADTPR
jgi:glyoxylase-like metal-dependent hydrolase (beta-lactamase superfamily II)